MPNVDDYDPGLLRGVHRAIISVLDFDSFESLAAHVNHLVKNESAYREYLQYQTVPASQASKVHRREVVRKDLKEYFDANKNNDEGVALSWFCDRVINGSQPRAKPTELCYQTWHSFMKKLKGKEKFIAEFSGT